MLPNDYWIAGETALDNRNLALAERHYRAALAIDPVHTPSLIGLSTVLTRTARHADSHAAALAAYESRPTAPPVVYAVAQRLRYFQEFERLIACLQAPGFANGAPPAIVAKAASMLSAVGAHGEAVDLLEKALQRHPRDAACLHMRATLHHFQGRTADAERFCEASLAADPLLYQNYHLLAGLTPVTPERNRVERIRKELKRAKPGGNGEIYLGFALHKELHDLRRYDEAWDALERASTAKRRQLRYSPADDEALVDALVEVCGAESVVPGRCVDQPATPVFIIGMHRSGTTLLERMLAGHSEISDAGETAAFRAEMELAIDRAAPLGPDAEFVRRMRGADFEAIARGYARRARWLAKGRPVFTEKLPQNFLNAGFVARALPQARFVHLSRDPMDTCFSNLRVLFGGVAPYSYDQIELGRFYLQYRRMMAHWREVLGPRMLELAYDDLVTDPERAARLVAAHCGVAYEPGMVDIQRSDGAIATPSASAIRQGFQRNRGAVWRHYEAHLQPLLDVLAPLYRNDGASA